MIGDAKENVIEWLNGDDTVTCTFSQRKYITKVEKLQKKWPNLVSILHENSDGSIVASLPLKSVKLNIISTEERDYSEAAERLREMHKANNK